MFKFSDIRSVLLDLWKIASSPRDLVTLAATVAGIAMVLLSFQPVTVHDDVDTLKEIFAEKPVEGGAIIAALVVFVTIILYLRRTIFDLEHYLGGLKEENDALRAAAHHREMAEQDLEYMEDLLEKDDIATMRLQYFALSDLVGRALKLARKPLITRDDYNKFLERNEDVRHLFDRLRGEAPHDWVEATHQFGRHCVDFITALEASVETGRTEPLGQRAEALREVLNAQDPQLRNMLEIVKQEANQRMLDG